MSRLWVWKIYEAKKVDGQFKKVGKYIICTPDHRTSQQTIEMYKAKNGKDYIAEYGYINI